MLNWTCHPAAEGLAVWTAGPASAVPVVLLHGFFQDGRAWQALLQRLPEALAQQILWICPDLPGHGRSHTHRLQQFGDGAWPALANLLDTTLAPLLHRPVTVAGYSFGGRAAAYWLTHSPLLQRVGVHGALLESAHPGLTQVERSLRIRQDNDRAERLLLTGTTEFALYWSSLELFASQTRLPTELLTHQAAMRQQQDAAALADHLRALGTGTMPQLAALAAPNWPLILLVGSLDPTYCRLAQAWQDAWPRSRYVEVAGAGHNVHLEQPAEWWRQLWDLLGPLPPRFRLD